MYAYYNYTSTLLYLCIGEQHRVGVGGECRGLVGIKLQLVLVFSFLFGPCVRRPRRQEMDREGGKVDEEGYEGYGDVKGGRQAGFFAWCREVVVWGYEDEEGDE